MIRESASGKRPLQLHELLNKERDAILEEWARIGRSELAAARELSNRDQIDNMPKILDSIAVHSKKAKVRQPSATPTQEGAKIHAEQRWRIGFSLENVTREYGMLRRVIIRKIAPHINDLSGEELVFLHESLDEAILESVISYVTYSNRVLESERERLEVTLKSIGDGVISTDAVGRITYMNPAAERILGWSRDAALHQPADKVLVAVDQESRKPSKCLVQVAIETSEAAHHPSEIELRTYDGDFLPAEEIAAPLRNSEGQFLGVVTTFRDVSRVRALTSELGYQAAHDSLTNLPNRSLLIDRLNQEIAHAERHNDRLALLYLDLDLFKDVNDMLGHTVGDELLKQVADRLRRCVRRTDTVCRVGGDEFIILLTEFGALEDLSELGSKVARKLKVPYRLGNDTVDISTSVGVAVYPDDGRDPQTLIKHADVAMYQAKALGRNDVQFFTPDMNRRATERRKLQGDLRNALASDQLSLSFQPQMALGSNEIVGAEVLLRWKHPQLGMVPPGRFIPVAEDNRQIMITIGNWVIEQACRQARLWMNEGYPPLRVSVNVSAAQLRDGHFVEHIDNVLTQCDIPPDQLQLELTESLLMSDIPGSAERVSLLEAMGVKIAVDDFGTGYSSLSYLKNLPVDELKIDQSFVRNIRADVGNAPIVQAIIRMGQSLKLRVIAEGVEDQEAVNFLTANGCEGAQGYYFSEPLPADAFKQQFLHSLH